MLKFKECSVYMGFHSQEIQGRVLRKFRLLGTSICSIYGGFMFLERMGYRHRVYHSLGSWGSVYRNLGLGVCGV